MRRPKILNVDDRDINRYIRSEVLRKADYDVLEADRGRDTLQLSLSENPDLILLDVHMPDMSGLEVCRLLKADERTSGIMVVQISASAVEFTDAVVGLDHGADDYLVEPVEPELLLAKVRSMLRLRAAEQALRRSNDDLRQFAYAASHDLQEPLRAVTTFAQLLRHRYGSGLDETANEYMRSIIDGSVRMRQLIVDLLEYSRVSAEADEAPKAVDVHGAVRDVLQTLAPLIRDIEAVVTCDALPVVQGNEVRLRQVFSNLIGNALKYRRPGTPPRIHVSAQQRQTDWVFSVLDNGMGFDPHHAESIFGVFCRLHGRNVPGSGIGLAICKSVVERAGGRIWAESRVGEGSCFRFTWPLARSAEAAG